MQVQDDRTPEQLTTHTWFVIGTDSFMSGWGQAQGGKSYAAWACEPKHSQLVLAWVERRSDMLRVRETIDPCFDGTRYRPSGTGHCHIYVVTAGHPALLRAA